ncbi:diguanylate cyclase [Sulfurimonas sp.]|uniref:diguanylate cyclase n=1 Tax=Sulfurimonas sp. TaxID=2022749 RepID=UPI002AB019F5|nr:transporter substrate-binding domain-containing protein [Sulfurimonas sp.]
MQKIVFIIFFLIISILALQAVSLTQKEKAFLKKNPTIILGTDSSWEPFVMKDFNGRIIGYNDDILSIINKITGANFAQVLGNWSQIQEKAKSKEIDGLSVTAIFKEQKKWFNFSDIYISSKKIVMTKRGNPKNIKSDKDLDGKTIAILKGNISDENIVKKFKNSKIIYADTTKQMLTEIIYGEADVIFGHISITYLLSKMGLPYLDFAYPLEHKLDLVFSIRKDWPEALSILNKGLATISNHERIRLKQKWFFATANTKLKELTLKEKKYLKNKKQITMCIDPMWMPFESVENGKHIGISASYFKIFKKEIGIPIKLIATHSWTQSLEFAKKRKCDILSLLMPTKKNSEYLNFSKKYLEAPIGLATNKNISFIDNFNGLKGMKIGIVKDYGIAQIIKIKYPDINIIEIQNITDGLQQVERGEIFGCIDTIPVISNELQSNYSNNLKISGKLNTTIKLGVGVRNDDLILLSIFNKIIENLTPKIEQDILSKHIPIKYEQEFDYSLFIKFFAILTLISIFLLYRYITLQTYNKKIARQLKIINKNVLISSSNEKGIITDISEALSKLSGYKKEELIGKHHDILRHKDTSSITFKDMLNTLLKKKIWQGEIKNLKKDGSSYWVAVTITPILDKSFNIKSYHAISHNITDKKELERLSITDALTKIPNRLHLDNSYEKELKRVTRHKYDLSIIIIDIDFFKKINDTYGHKIGDNILVEFATILKQNIRSSDTLGRWGGEEFLIICPETNLEKATILAQKIREKIQNFNFSDINKLTCSAGVSSYSENDKQEETFIRADKALYEAKNSGRNKVVSLCV